MLERSIHALLLAGALLLSSATASGGEATLPTFTPPPPVTEASWMQWYEQLLDTRIADVEFSRDQSRYVSSTDGDDEDDGLTPESAWASFQRAIDWINSSGDETREVLFRRGDSWYATSGLITAKPGVRIADFGDPKLPRPYISGFAARFPAGSGGWSLAPPPYQSAWVRPVQDMVYWVRQDGDADLDAPLTVELSVEGVHATAGSWWYDDVAGMLYVHPHQSDAAGDHLFAACTAEGNAFQMKGDRTLVENIRADGWGMDEPQHDPFQSRVAGTDRALFRNCVSYYCYTHVMSHYVGGGIGGVATFIDCTAGYTRYHPVHGETMFNTYARDGAQETIFHGCTVARGTLPTAEVTPYRRRGMAAFGHAQGTVGLAVIVGLTVADHPYGGGAPPTIINLPEADTIDQVRCFVVDCVVEPGEGSGSAGAALFQKDIAFVNCRYTLKPDTIDSATLQGKRVDGWWINSTLDLDCSNQPGPFFGLYKTSANDDQPRLWNSSIFIRNLPSGVQLRIDYSGPTSSPDGTMFNSILAKLSGEGTVSANLPNDPAHMLANGYWQVDAPSGDELAVELASPPSLDEPPTTSSPLVGAATALPGGTSLEFDQLLQPRNRDTIGPLEAVLAGDVNGDGAVDVADLVEVITTWGVCPDPPATCPADINGDGVVNITDLIEVIVGWGGR